MITVNMTVCMQDDWLEKDKRGLKIIIISLWASNQKPLSIIFHYNLITKESKKKLIGHDNYPAHYYYYVCVSFINYYSYYANQ